ncbi:hypothetical protein WDU94_015106 [Cyamophila willieti]
MAGNFGDSTHSQQWILDKQTLLRDRNQDLTALSDLEYEKIFIFFINFIHMLGEQLNLPQLVTATASVYLKRFYVKISLKCVDPLLLASTCVSLASKVEEYGPLSGSKLLSSCQTVIKNEFTFAYSEFPYRTSQILECEFYLLEYLNCCLIVFQPYHPLLEMTKDLVHEEQLVALARRLITDSLKTDACLLYAPDEIALGCVQAACTTLHREKQLKSWFARQNVDLKNVQEVARLIINSLGLKLSYDEKKEIPALLAKMPKPSKKDRP